MLFFLYQSARPADKPHSVPQTGMLAHGAGGEGHLSCSRVTPRLQQPTRDSRKTSRFPPSEEGFASAWLCSHWGLPGRCITANAGGLLNHHFTLALAGGMFLWPYRQVAPSRDFPGFVPCGVRTFLNGKRSTAITRPTRSIV